MHHNKGTQTTIIRTENREVQTMTESNRAKRKRSPSRDNRKRERWWHSRNNSWERRRDRSQMNSSVPRYARESEQDREHVRERRSRVSWPGLHRRSELDKYFQKTSCSEHRPPEAMQNTLQTSNSELWDAELPERGKPRIQLSPIAKSQHPLTLEIVPLEAGRKHNGNREPENDRMPSFKTVIAEQRMPEAMGISVSGGENNDLNHDRLVI